MTYAFGVTHTNVTHLYLPPPVLLSVFLSVLDHVFDIIFT